MEAEKDYGNVACNLCNLAEINIMLNNTEQAIQYLDQASEFCELLNKSSDNKGQYVWRKTTVYNLYSMFYLEREDVDKALEYAIKADSMFDTSISIINRCNNYTLLAEIYLKKGDYELSLSYTDKAMEQADLLKNSSLYMQIYIVISDVYLAQKRYQEASEAAMRAWQIDSTDFDASRATAFNLVLSYACMGAHTQAEHYLNAYKTLSKEFSERSLHAAIADMTLKYETEKKEMRIADLEHQKNLYIAVSIIGILLAIAFMALLILRSRNIRKAQQLVIANSILDWEQKERKRFASDLHDGVSGMLAAVKMGLHDGCSLPEIRDNIDVCIETVRRLARGMTPVSLERFGLKAALEDYCSQFPIVHFHFFGVDLHIEKQKESVMYFSACELITNAIRHANATLINVQLVINEDRISLTVQDNGCGFDRNSCTNGNGLKNISERLSHLNGSVIDINSYSTEGTEITITV